MVRFKNRYFLCEYIVDNQEKEMTQLELLKLIKESIHFNFGDLGLAKLQFSIQIKYMNSISRIFILRVARDTKNWVWNSLIFINEFDHNPFQVRILGCSGTIKKCELKARRLLSRWVHKILKHELPDKMREILIKDFQNVSIALPELSQ